MSELSANEVVKIVQELKALERKFGGENGLINHVSNISANLNSQYHDIDDSKKELELLFQKLQNFENIELQIKTLHLEFVGKKEFEDLVKLVEYIKLFKIFMTKKTDEINDAYKKLNRLWLEENDVLIKIDKLQKSFLSLILLGTFGIGIGFSIGVYYQLIR